MKDKTRESGHFAGIGVRLLAVVMLLVVFLTGAVATAGGRASNRPCKATAKLALQAAMTEARGEYWLAVAKATTLNSYDDRKDAFREAKEDLRANTGEAYEQYRARLDLCDALDEVRYDPDIDPDDFMTPAQVAANPNRYMPLVPGTTYRYEGETEEGTEIIVVEITDETRDILGVPCMVVRDTVWVGGELVEDTHDWYTQDTAGNVWYFGERSFEYEDGEIANMAGSWEAGLDGAKPGIVMKAAPEVDDIYRQEFLLGEAEDAAEVLALDESVTVPFGSFDECLKTGEFTPLDPDVYEHKYYAPGVGLVLEVDTETGEQVELISVVME